MSWVAARMPAGLGSTEIGEMQATGGVEARVMVGLGSTGSEG